MAKSFGRSTCLWKEWRLWKPEIHILIWKLIYNYANNKKGTSRLAGSLKARQGPGQNVWAPFPLMGKIQIKVDFFQATNEFCVVNNFHDFFQPILGFLRRCPNSPPLVETGYEYVVFNRSAVKSWILVWINVSLLNKLKRTKTNAMIVGIYWKGTI